MNDQIVVVVVVVMFEVLRHRSVSQTAWLIFAASPLSNHTYALPITVPKPELFLG